MFGDSQDWWMSGKTNVNGSCFETQLEKIQFQECKMCLNWEAHSAEPAWGSECASGKCRQILISVSDSKNE